MHKDLIVFGEDWHGLPSSTQHLIRHLSEDRRVIWINSIGLRQPKFSIADLKRAFNKLAAVFTKSIATKSTFKTRDTDSKAPHSKAPHSKAPQLQVTKHQSENFIVVNPLTIPAPKSKLGRYLAVKMLMNQLKPILKKANFHQPVLWTSLPTAVDFSGEFNESAMVYYCGDDFSGLAGVDHATVAKREQQLLEKSDFVMASSQALVDGFPQHKTQLLSHGVDFDLFDQPAAVAKDLPGTEKVAGFYGSISNWLDISLLCETIRKMPDWQFVFIGKVEVDISQLHVFKNVSFLGPRAHHLLPEYSQHWTVSLLPFVDNAQIRACNPLKLSEYLAAGKPIVATSFPAAEARKPLVRIANNSDEMVDAIIASQALANDHKHRQALKAAVKSATWRAKAQQVSQWLGAL